MRGAGMKQTTKTRGTYKNVFQMSCAPTDYFSNKLYFELEVDGRVGKLIPKMYSVGIKKNCVIELIACKQKEAWIHAPKEFFSLNFAFIIFFFFNLGKFI